MPYTTQTLADLIAMRELLAVPERWTQRAFARTARMDKTFATDGRATCWCLLGAAQAVTRLFNDGYVPLDELEADPAAARCEAIERVLDGLLGGTSIDTFNDGGVWHDDIVALLDRAVVTVRSTLEAPSMAPVIT